MAEFLLSVSVFFFFSQNALQLYNLLFILQVKAKGVQHLIEIENPNRVVHKERKVQDIKLDAENTQLSRRERYFFSNVYLYCILVITSLGPFAQIGFMQSELCTSFSINIVKISFCLEFGLYNLFILNSEAYQTRTYILNVDSKPYEHHCLD